MIIGNFTRAVLIICTIVCFGERQAAALTWRFASDSDGATTAKGACTTDQKGRIEEAFQRAQRHSASLKTYMNIPDNVNAIREGKWPVYTQYFGAFDEDNFNIVTATVTAISDYLQDPSKVAGVACNIVTTAEDTCRPQTRARIKLREKGKRGGADLDFLFCQAFFVSSGSVEHTEWGTIVHEISHIVANTSDWRYGDDPVRAMAEEDADAAVLNADSYRYFTERFADSVPAR